MFQNILITYFLDSFLNYYLSEWKVQPNIVGITYSRVNCDKNNFAIQDQLDMEADREPPENREEIKFYVGDRCTLDKPIELCNMSYYPIEYSCETYIQLDGYTGETLYNGETFDIIEVKEVFIKTELNKENCDVSPYFNGQLLKIKRITIQCENKNCTSSSQCENKNCPILANTYEILHIDKKLIFNAKIKLRKKLRKFLYLNIMTNFVKKYPIVNYGYFMTLYKSQGSEWHTVLVHLVSIKWSIVGDGSGVDLTKKKALYRATNTACTRASHKLKLFWN